MDCKTTEMELWWITDTAEIRTAFARTPISSYISGHCHDNGKGRDNKKNHVEMRC